MANTEKNRKYWEERATNDLVIQERTTEEKLKRIQSLYKKTLRNLEKEINDFWTKYATDNEMSIADAQKYLNNKEKKSYIELLNDYYDEITGYSPSPNYKKNLEKLKQQAKITRLEELYTNFNHELELLYSQIQDIRNEYAPEVYEKSHYLTEFTFAQGLGTALTFTDVPKRILNRASNMDWNGSMFSDQVWNNKAKLLQQLQIKIPQGIAMGKNSKVIAKDIAQSMGAGYKNVVRVVRTEVNAIYNGARKDLYEDFKVKMYIYVATLDSRTSQICQQLDGQEFNVKDAVVGTNYPPMHAHCRSTTVPKTYTIPTERIAKDQNGKRIMVPGDMTYKTYAKQYQPKIYQKYWKNKD